MPEHGPGHRGPVIEAVRRVLREAAVTTEPSYIEVDDAEDAARLRFLGSPSVRVNGHDIEPGATGRTDFVFACRIYRTDSGMSGQPDERWLRDALAR